MLSKVYRTEVSTEEYLAYTTEENEKIKVHEYAKKYGSIKKGIAALALDIGNGVFLSLVLFVICISCTSKIKSITGIYVNHSKNELSTAMDTIVIRPDNNGSYFIERRTGYSRIINGVTQTKKIKKENSVGVLDKESGLIREQKYGRTYLVTEEGGGLIIGNAFYRKIK